MYQKKPFIWGGVVKLRLPLQKEIWGLKYFEAAELGISKYRRIMDDFQLVCWTMSTDVLPVSSCVQASFHPHA